MQGVAICPVKGTGTLARWSRVTVASIRLLGCQPAPVAVFPVIRAYLSRGFQISIGRMDQAGTGGARIRAMCARICPNSAHSLHSGCVTEAARQGVATLDTMALTTHRSVETLRRYYRPSWQPILLRGCEGLVARGGEIPACDSPSTDVGRHGRNLPQLGATPTIPMQSARSGSRPPPGRAVRACRRWRCGRCRRKIGHASRRSSGRAGHRAARCRDIWSRSGRLAR